MSAPDERGLHPRPTAVELLEAVEEWLRGSVVPGVPGQIGFHARVAANVVATVRRELLAGEAPHEAHRARLASLGVDSDRTLAAAIRAGALDDRWPEVLDALRADARAALEVANPGHLELPPEHGLPGTLP